MRIILLILVLLSVRLLAISQPECRSFLYRQEQIARSPSLSSNIAAVESFTRNWLESRKTGINDIHDGSKGFTVITIPVVVHIIYNSPAQNISDAQIRSQIDILNKDYRRMNADTAGTPDVFRSFAADCRLQFELARSDPKGFATNGIIRRHSDIQAFSQDDGIKSSAAGGDDGWDSEHYLNIWVANLVPGILGYSSVVGGPKERDGVVIKYSAFGTGGAAAAPFNRGRTATHEIGHWLNLIHTWGDADCGDDEVNDTPPQHAANRGCPGSINITCGSGPYGDMYMNFMDFTDDACMNLFTSGQRDRMQALFAPGGPRYAILSSTALNTAPNGPDTVALTPDAGALLAIYPNPASAVVSIKTADVIRAGSTLEIFNGMGQKVMTVSLTQHLQQVNVSSLRTGIYYIHTGNANIAKLVKL